ncbi:MAG: IS66 family insertion sequence element accessory protein TnpB [Desulfobulbaceae bacterium]|uniref:IS66 family insertion sequence element accessory protein TnpB n=1 Tax=Candidatus Desulfobia pelagia TaxID=2841692 RepID=A0A8J6NF87_9BACT|nr:IS66 family insertion sequence element accessory protein TnpB [Candidatus Desulfobia pelagia]
MILGQAGVKVYLAIGSTDMRKSINGLSILVEDQLNLDPFSGHLFAFCNRKRNMVKILYWDHNGFCLWHKRLEQDRFQWPESRQEVLDVSRRELNWLIDGLTIYQQRTHKELRYSAVL